MVLCCLRGVFACVSRTWLPLEHSLLLSEPCWGNGCLHSTWPVVCIFAGCCWCNLCVNIFIYIYIYTHTQREYIHSTPQKSSSGKRCHKPKRRRSAVYSWYICTQYPFFFPLSLSLSTYDWVTGFGRRDDHYSNLLFLGDIPFFLPKKRRIISNLLIWPSASPTLPPLGLCKSTNKSNQLANPKHQKISSIHVLKSFVANMSSGSRPNNLHLEQWRLERLNRFVLQVDRFLFHWWWYQDHFLVNQKSKRIEDGKVDWCVSWNPDDLCW